MEKNPSVSEADPQICEEAEIIADRIRERAYELYILRGQSDGHDLDDWLLAESQLLQKQRAEDS